MDGQVGIEREWIKRRMALTLTRRQVPVRGSHIELQSDERTHTGIKVMKSVPKRV